MHRTHVPARLALVGAVTGTAVLALALPASAHVTVNADDARRGAADAVLTFRVPNEKDNAATTKVVVTLPTRDPIASVSPVPLPGWSVASTSVTFAKPITTDDGTITTGVGTVTWTATGAGIPVGQAGLFQLLVGPLPDTATVAFPTKQTYSDGSVVSWVEPTLPGQPEPDHPAPVLQLTTASAPAATSSAAPSVSASSKTTGKDSSARALGIAGIALGALAIASAGLLARRRTG